MKHNNFLLIKKGLFAEGGVFFGIRPKKEGINLLFVEYEESAYAVESWEQLIGPLNEEDQAIFDARIEEVLSSKKSATLVHTPFFPLPYQNEKLKTILVPGEVRGTLLGLSFPTDGRKLDSDQGVYLAERLAKEKRENENLKTTLSTLLKVVEKEKENLKENMSLYIHESILPLIKEIKEGRSPRENIRLLTQKISSLIEGRGGSVFLIQSGLTKKEIEICHHIISGQSGKDIAREISISYQTLRTHTRNIRKKLGLSRSQNLSLYLQEYITP